MTDEITYKLFKAIEDHLANNNRNLATNRETGLNKLNSCPKALLDKGFIKAENFKSSGNKRSYLYKMTSAGISERAAVTFCFFRNKMAEYEKIKHEIQLLKEEMKTW